MARESLRDCVFEGARDVRAGASLRQRHMDGDESYAIEPLYVLPRDGSDRGRAVDGTISRSISAMQGWFAEKTGGTRFRFVDGGIPTVRIRETDADIASRGAAVRDRVEELLHDEGYDDPRRLYAVWYEGTSTFSCGGGAWPPTLIGHVAALYLQGRYDGVDCAQDRFSSDGTTVEINELKMLHEILHTLGFVAENAPNHTLSGHTSDSPQDLMYAGRPGPPFWDPSELDVGHDDYYRTGRGDIPDLSRSVFLDPLPDNPTAPPGW
jgi:hypothetical protein